MLGPRVAARIVNAIRAALDWREDVMPWYGLWFGPWFVFPLISRLEGRSGERPLDTLKRRYARGQITREQFEQMRHDIE